MKMIESASSRQLYAILATLECAHEPDQLARAQEQLDAFGCTREELEAEWDRREALQREAERTVVHIPV